MQTWTLTCSDVSPDRLVAYFCNRHTEVEVFAYLPHVPGLNPYLLRVGDTIEGVVKERHERLELIEASGQKDRRGSGQRTAGSPKQT